MATIVDGALPTAAEIEAAKNLTLDDLRVLKAEIAEALRTGDDMIAAIRRRYERTRNAWIQAQGL